MWHACRVLDFTEGAARPYVLQFLGDADRCCKARQPGGPGRRQAQPPPPLPASSPRPAGELVGCRIRALDPLVGAVFEAGVWGHDAATGTHLLVRGDAVLQVWLGGDDGWRWQRLSPAPARAGGGGGAAADSQPPAQRQRQPAAAAAPSSPKVTAAAHLLVQLARGGAAGADAAGRPDAEVAAEALECCRPARRLHHGGPLWGGGAPMMIC